MTDIEQKALELVNEVNDCVLCSMKDARGYLSAFGWQDTLFRAIKAHESDKSRHAAELREQAERARRKDGWQFARSVLHQIVDGEATQADIAQWLEDAEQQLAADAIERGEP